MSLTRRTLLQSSSLAPFGLVLPGCATPVARAAGPSSAPAPTGSVAAYTPRPLPFDPTALPGLSAKLLRSHHENNYTGAVKKLGQARQRLAEVGPDTPAWVLGGLSRKELGFKHSVVLHELYFDHLTGGGSKGSVTTKILSEHFGSAAAWEERFRALGASLGGGSGWAILEYDLHEGRPRMYTAGDHTQGLSSGIPLIVLDMYEHSYHMDYGTAANKYIDAFFANLHWEEIDARTEQARKMAELVGT